MFPKPMITNEANLHNSQDLKETSANKITISAMLEVYKSVLNQNEVFYCSAPITSGKRYIDWLDRIEKKFVDIDSVDKSDRESHFTEVVEPNRKHAQHFISQLRKQTGQIVIDPTALPQIPDWKQQDWHSFWRQVIEKYASTVFLVDDWQYSNGCVYEFWVAHNKRIPTLNEDKHSLSLAVGIDMVTEAIGKIRQRGVTTIFFDEILNKMKNIST